MSKQEITTDGLITDITLDKLINGFSFEKGIANILKFSLLGLYVKNDELEIEQLEAAFKKDGALYDKRAYKTEAKRIYSILLSGDDITVDGTIHTLDTISKVHLDNLPFSVGVVYKKLPKAGQTKTKSGFTRNKIAKEAINNESIDTDMFSSPKKLLDAREQTDKAFIKDFIDDAMLKAEEALTLGIAQGKANKALLGVPAYNLDKVAFMETLKGMLSQIHALEGDLTEVTDYIMELQTTPVEAAIAA